MPRARAYSALASTGTGAEPRADGTPPFHSIPPTSESIQGRGGGPTNHRAGKMRGSGEGRRYAPSYAAPAASSALPAQVRESRSRPTASESVGAYVASTHDDVDTSLDILFDILFANCGAGLSTDPDAMGGTKDDGEEGRRAGEKDKMARSGQAQVEERVAARAEPHVPGRESEGARARVPIPPLSTGGEGEDAGQPEDERGAHERVRLGEGKRGRAHEGCGGRSRYCLGGTRMSGRRARRASERSGPDVPVCGRRAEASCFALRTLRPPPSVFPQALVYQPPPSAPSRTRLPPAYPSSLARRDTCNAVEGGEESSSRRRRRGEVPAPAGRRREKTSQAQRKPRRSRGTSGGRACIASGLSWIERIEKIETRAAEQGRQGHRYAHLIRVGGW
ncbi:hypothetical protein FB451DRAFT_1391739 [Mycena latifolia]|nr:hypothetical protein FB451DRAFT_1391739 [Mycena latifolia]